MGYRSRMKAERRRHRQKPSTLVPCVLCGQPARMFGIFVPSAENQHRVCAPPGKLRTVAYWLCDACRRRPDSETAVEELIFNDFALQRAVMEN